MAGVRRPPESLLSCTAPPSPPQHLGLHIRLSLRRGPDGPSQNRGQYPFPSFWGALPHSYLPNKCLIHTYPAWLTLHHRAAKLIWIHFWAAELWLHSRCSVNKYDFWLWSVWKSRLFHHWTVIAMPTVWKMSDSSESVLFTCWRWKFFLPLFPRPHLPS